MSHYRDHLDAAQARIETLEAKLNERDASLAARDAELAEMRAEIARLRGDGQDEERPPRGHDLRDGQRALLAALAVCGFATATGYAVVRPSHCHGGRAFSAPVVRPTPTPVATIDAMDLGPTVGSATIGPAQRAAPVHVSDAAFAALEDAKRRVDACRQEGDGGPSGPGSATIAFLPAGGVEVFLAPPYAGTDVGACVAQIYRAARVPRFDGKPIFMTANFSL
jgi:hypothetical protein